MCRLFGSFRFTLVRMDWTRMETDTETEGWVGYMTVQKMPGPPVRCVSEVYLLVIFSFGLVWHWRGE